MTERTFEQQVDELLQEVYLRAPELKNSLAVEASPRGEEKPNEEFALTITCRPTQRKVVLAVQWPLPEGAPPTLHPSWDFFLVKRLREYFGAPACTVAFVYEAFLGRKWVSRTVPAETVGDVLSGLDNQGYRVYSVTLLPGSRDVLILVFSPHARLNLPVGNRVEPQLSGG